MRLRSVLVLLGFFIYFASCVRQNEIEIGAVLELTGDGAEIGKDAQRGMELAVSEINEDGGITGRKLKILYL